MTMGDGFHYTSLQSYRLCDVVHGALYDQNFDDVEVDNHSSNLENSRKRRIEWISRPNRLRVRKRFGRIGFQDLRVWDLIGDFFSC